MPRNPHRDWLLLDKRERLLLAEKAALESPDNKVRFESAPYDLAPFALIRSLEEIRAELAVVEEAIKDSTSGSYEDWPQR